MDNGKRRRGQVRKTVNFSLPPELEEYVRERAERSHGGNVSHFIRSLIWAERDRDADIQKVEAAA